MNSDSSVINQLYLQLKDKILTGYYAPNYHLTENHIAEEFKVSRVAVREALSRLIGDNLIEKIPHKGVRIRDISLEEIKDIYVVRIYLDALAARLLAESQNSAVFDELKKIMREDVAAIRAENYLVHLNLMNKYQQFVIEGCGNKALKKAVEPFLAIQSMYRFNMALAIRMNKSFETHAKLLEAMVSGNGNLSESIMRQHVQETLDIIVNHYASLDRASIL